MSLMYIFIVDKNHGFSLINSELSIGQCYEVSNVQYLSKLKYCSLDFILKIDFQLESEISGNGIS